MIRQENYPDTSSPYAVAWCVIAIAWICLMLIAIWMSVQPY